MINTLKTLYQAISYVLAPPFCERCRIFLDKSTVFCVPCYDKIQPVVSKLIQITPSVVMPVYAVGTYQDPLQSLILAKSRGNQLAAKQLAYLMWEHSTIRFADVDMFVPIPLHWSRYAYRGYNQAEIMAQELASFSGKSINLILSRTIRTPFLSSVTVAERFGVVKDVFEVSDPQNIKGKHIVLVDDVMTTSATLRAAAKKLLRYKPASIKALVAARTP